MDEAVKINDAPTQRQERLIHDLTTAPECVCWWNWVQHPSMEYLRFWIQNSILNFVRNFFRYFTKFSAWREIKCIRDPNPWSSLTLTIGSTTALRTSRGCWKKVAALLKIPTMIFGHLVGFLLVVWHLSLERAQPKNLWWWAQFCTRGDHLDIIFQAFREEFLSSLVLSVFVSFPFFLAEKLWLHPRGHGIAPMMNSKVRTYSKKNQKSLSTTK